MSNHQQAAYYQQYAAQYAAQQQAAGAQQAQHVNPQKYKSTLCNVWLMEGVCARGRMCHYAHGIRELNYSQYYNFYGQQTPAGPTVAAGNNAGYAKSDDYQNRFYKTAICQFWQQRGVCNNGDNCRWAHGEHELRKQETNGNEPQEEGQQQNLMIGPQLEGDQIPETDAGQNFDGVSAGQENGGGTADGDEAGGESDRGRKRNAEEAGLGEGQEEANNEGNTV